MHVTEGIWKVHDDLPVRGRQKIAATVHGGGVSWEAAISEEY
jgi:hypothetical protein